MTVPSIRSRHTSSPNRSCEMGMQTHDCSKLPPGMIPLITLCVMLGACGSRHNSSAVLNDLQAACVSGNHQACDTLESSSLPTAARSGLDSAAVRRFFDEDTHRNVGQTLPAGIKVSNRSNSLVDLRTMLATRDEPVILLRLEPECPPCQMLLDYVRSNAELYTGMHGVRLAVIEVAGTKGSGLDSSRIPEEILFFKSGDKLDTGFLSGHISPAAFFFDKDLKLVARRAGLTTPQGFLRFPEMAEAKN